MGCMFFWVKFAMHLLILWFHVYLPDGAIIQYKFCKTKLFLLVPGKHGKYIFTKEMFYLQGILNNINEQDTSFLDCKHKHMMKSGAPPDTVLLRLLPIEFLGFTNILISKVYHSLIPCLISIFLETVWVPLISVTVYLLIS